MLWTNNSPTNSFAAQDITLNDSLSNYEFVKLVYRISTSDSSEHFTIATTSDIPDDTVRVCMGGAYSERAYVRYVNYKSDTSVSITTALGVHSNTSSDALSIPVAIYGVN